MADIKPFRGIRYDQQVIGDLGLVVCPVYDVIDEAARDAYYNKHPFNVIRLVLNRPEQGDRDAYEPYRRAGALWRKWLDQGIVVKDPAPSIYLYRERYILAGEYKECTGYVARVRVEDFSKGSILPHEQIMPKPFEDRMRLLEETGANFDMVHALYSDPEERLRDRVIAEMERFPLAQFQTSDGVWHDLWGVSDERFVNRVSSFLKMRPLYIADGHHRYQTACEYAERLRQAGDITDADDPRNFLMMMIVEMENPGLSVLPVHRVITRPLSCDSEELLKGLAQWFAVDEVDVPRGARSGQVFLLLKRLEEAGRGGCAFGMFLREPERFLLLTLRSDADLDSEIKGGLSAAYRGLDVTILHKMVLEKLLCISQDRASVEKNLAFTRDPMEAVRCVDEGKGSVVLFTNATKVEQVREVADHGEKMPQKSTYFYPKPWSGVVMNNILEW